MTTTTRAAAVLVAALAALSLLPMPAAATGSHDSGNGNHGTVKIHDELETNPPVRNVPHVDCEDFWVEGFNMAASSGTLTFYSWPPTGNMTVALEAAWEADDETNEHFVEGPFMLPAGHYKLAATNIDGHTKHKVFWVDACEPAVIECPVDLYAVANADGTITLHFEQVGDATGYNLYRAAGDGEFEFVAQLMPTTHTVVDIGTEVGVTYTYIVATSVGDAESSDCAAVEVTSIPEFPTLGAMALAAVLGTVGYVALRRRN